MTAIKGSTTSTAQRSQTTNNASSLKAESKPEAKKLEATKADKFPSITADDDAFEDSTQTQSKSMPSFRPDGVIPAADAKAQNQLSNMLNSARLGAPGATTGVAPKEEKPDEGSVLDDLKAGAGVGKNATKLADKLATSADARGRTTTAGRLRSTSSSIKTGTRGANVATNAAKLLDGDATGMSRAEAGVKVVAEGSELLKSGAEAVGKRATSEAVQNRAASISGGAGRTAKVAGNLGKGAGVLNAVGTLTDENAAGTKKAEALATGSKAAAELAKEGAEFIAKRAAKSSSKAVAKTAAKTIAKSIPIIGIAADVAATADSAREAYKTFNDPNASTGDKVVAGLHTVTQAVGVVPVVGDVISIAGDLGKAAWGWFSGD